MPLLDVFLSLVRRWPIVLVGILLTGTALYYADQDRGVYYTRTEVTFLAPSSRAYPNALSTTTEGLIVAAGTVGRLVTGPGKVAKFASPDVDLVGLGVRKGWAVRLPDTGGQWAPNFGQQVLIVEVVGPTNAEVAAQRDQLIRRINVELDRFQRREGVASVNAITTKVTPESSVIRRVEGSRTRALAMVALLGCAATVGAVALLEARARRKRDRPAKPEHDVLPA